MCGNYNGTVTVIIKDIFVTKKVLCGRTANCVCGRCSLEETQQHLPNPAWSLYTCFTRFTCFTHALHMLYTCFTCFTCFPHALWRHIWQQTVEKSICPVPLHMLIQRQLACGAFSMQCGTPTNALVHLARPTTNVRKWKYERWKSNTNDHFFFQIVPFEN